MSALEKFNIDKINKELKRVYGISNPNIVKTVLNEAAAPELLEACLIIEEFEKVETYSQEWDKLAEKHIKLTANAIKKATE